MYEISRLRKTLNLKQEELARILGVSRSHLGHSETNGRGLGKMPEVYLAQACRVMDTMPENIPFEIAIPDVSKEKAEKKLARISLVLKRKEKVLTDLEDQVKANHRKIEFLKALKAEPNLEKRKIVPYLDFLIKKTISEELGPWVGSDLADLRLEVEWWRAQKTFWEGKIT